MKKDLPLFFLKNSFLIAISVFSYCNIQAQPEDKSYLKKSNPDKYSHLAQFVPDSKYGPVVSPANLTEALKNPEIYKSARFSASGLTDFPEQLFLFPNLEEIDVSRNNIAALPLRLKEFKNLKELHVNKNKLVSLGSEITSCTLLEVIQIQNNPLENISTGLGSMKSLKEITIGEISSKCRIPAELWNLTGLRKLKITNANLTEIPVSIAQFKQLDALCLSNNAISDIPEELYSLKNITYINLGYNKIHSLSPAIKEMENLDYLGIYYNPLATFPEEIIRLKQLSYLSCWKTNISQKEIDEIRDKLPKTKVHNTETDLH